MTSNNPAETEEKSRDPLEQDKTQTSIEEGNLEPSNANSRSLTVEEELNQYLFLGIQEKLRKAPMIRDVQLTVSKPATESQVTAWERHFALKLPEDLRKFYLTCNGIQLTWNLEYSGNTNHSSSSGEIKVNSLEKLLPLFSSNQEAASGIRNAMSARCDPQRLTSRHRTTTSAAASHSRNHKKSVRDCSTIKYSDILEIMKSCSRQSFKEKCHSQDFQNLPPDGKIFVIDSGKKGCSNGKTCLVFHEDPESKSLSDQEKCESSDVGCKVEVWFMDPVFIFHYLAPSFMHFYRMQLYHLGIPGWQTRFTNYGVPKWTEQLFWLIAPHLMTQPKLDKFPRLYPKHGLWSSDLTSEVQNPNPVTNELQSTIFRRKRRDE